MAILDIVSRSESTVRFAIIGLDAGWTEEDNDTYGHRYVHLYANVGTTYPTEDIHDISFGMVTELDPGITQSDTFRATGLETDVSYSFTAIIKLSKGNTVIATLHASLVNLTQWSWTSSNGEASSTQTRNAYNAVTSNGYLEDFSFLVWNDMCNKVQAVLDATDDRWNTTYGSYNNTIMSTSDKELTARRFNALRYNIGSHVSTGINEVSAGDTVRGSYFITIVNSLNAWIAQYS